MTLLARDLITLGMSQQTNESTGIIVTQDTGSTKQATALTAIYFDRQYIVYPSIAFPEDW